uniref:Mitochondrial inner membrane protein OXA1 putative n=1 Tax=Albugo laibachii Nc14 TaxID=890382 RepID=F0WFB6_9STRA|nr:mitochondrial inner membrane protein OXA1 putative [Albugo laibachii Nc14]|eukprot:CCA19898.1 mitochondrial inner membrane protein OXA1 putative [Albugo laibachii Nc14]
MFGRLQWCRNGLIGNIRGSTSMTRYQTIILQNRSARCQAMTRIQLHRCISSSSTMNTSYEQNANDNITQIVAAASDSTTNAVPELGFGLGDLTIQALAYIHSTTGLPWWATIAVSTVIVRSVMIYPSIKGIRNAAKLKIIQPKLEKLKEEMEVGPRTPEKVIDFQRKYKALMSANDVSIFRGLYVPLFQIPMFLGFFWGLRELPKYYESCKEGGALWFTDLGAADPTYILPVLNAALMLVAVETGSEGGLNNDMRDKMKIGMRCMSVLMIPFTMHFETGLFVFWIASNTCSLAQSAMLRIPSIMNALDIPSEQQRQIYATAVPKPSPLDIALGKARKDLVIPTLVNKQPKKKTQKKQKIIEP